MIATKPNIFSRNHLIRDALGQALYDAMSQDSSIHLFGEGAHVKVHYDAPNIEADFPDRVHTMPISEDGNTNFAVGASLLGVKPVVDVIGADFLHRTLDSICNTAAKLNFTRPDQEPRTIVIRSEFLTGGPTTGQRPEALFTHIPGLRVVVPSTPWEAYGIMRSALVTSGVTLVFEDRMIEDEDDSGFEGGFFCPLGVASWCQRGLWSDPTILTYGVMRQVAERVIRKHNIQCTLIDLRSLSPIDWPFIEEKLSRCSKLLVIEPDITYGGIGAEILAHVAEEMPWVKVKRLGAPMATIPAAMSLHGEMLPGEKEILDAIDAINKS